MTTSTNSPAPSNSIKIKWILISIGLCLGSIFLTYLLKPTYVRNSSKLAIRTDKSLNEARLLLQDESNEKYRFISHLSSSKKSKIVLQDAADDLTKTMEKLTKKITALRVLLCEETDGIYSLEKNKLIWDQLGYRKIKISRDSTLDGTPISFKDRSASNKIFIKNGEAKKLKEEIIKTRNELFEILDNLVELSKNTEGVIFKSSDVDYVKINFKLEDPEKKSFGKSWLNPHFTNNTVAESLLLLRKLEFDCTAALFQTMSLLNDNVAY